MNHTYHVGFTGTRFGMTDHQRHLLTMKLSAIKARHGVVVFRHGDCLGADAEAHEIALDLGFSITIHPPIKAHLRAYCAAPGAVILRPKAYLERDMDIVDGSSCLIATPKTVMEERRSGTWATIRYARRSGKPVTLLHPY